MIFSHVLYQLSYLGMSRSGGPVLRGRRPPGRAALIGKEPGPVQLSVVPSQGLIPYSGGAARLRALRRQRQSEGLGGAVTQAEETSLGRRTARSPTATSRSPA